MASDRLDHLPHILHARCNHRHSAGFRPLCQLILLQLRRFFARPLNLDLDVPAAVTRRDVRRPGAAVRAAVVVSRSAAGEAV